MFKFGIVGVINTGITLGVIFIMMSWLGISYVISNAAGYTLGFINSFLMNRFWTFQSKGNPLVESLRFIGVFAVCYLIQLGMLVAMKEKMAVPREAATLIAMVLYTLLSYIGNKIFTFQKGGIHE